MKHPYADFLHEIEKPARYIGGEYGSSTAGDGFPVVLAFPDAYELGMCYLGFHILYDVLRREPGIEVERVFAPWKDLEDKLIEKNLPLVSLESARPLHQFPVVGFSLQYELSLTNMLQMLDLGRIPLKSEARTERDPLVIAGGPVAFQGEAAAPFVDAFVLGDGEEVLPKLVRRIRDFKERQTPRNRMLEQLSAIKGVYVPSLVPVSEDPATGMLVAPPGVKIERADPVDLSEHPFPSAIPVPDTGIVFDRYAVEIARGCNGGCRFCQGGFIYRPVRFRKKSRIAKAILDSLNYCGFESVSLTSLSTADYPGIEELVEYLSSKLQPRSVELSLSSLRAYSVPEKVLTALEEMRRSTLTLALEAGTQRLRDLINKNVREEDILGSAERAFRRGWNRIKLYFMIGLPTETGEDLAAIIKVTKAVRDTAARFCNRAARGVTASVSTFVPKAHTPLQWEGMIGEEEIRSRQRFLYDRAAKYGLSLKWHDSRMSVVEGVIARADRRVAEGVLRAYQLGCRFDAWSDQLAYDRWLEAFGSEGVDVARYLEARSPEGRLPWDHIHTGVDPEFLRRERDRAFTGSVTPACFFHGICHHCGVKCRTGQGASVAGTLPETPPEGGVGEEAAESSRHGKSKESGSGKKPPESAALRFRVTYHRFDRMRYTSQLDFVSAFPRVFRRAGILPFYSRGFHPKPVMSFAPALPLGASALRDVADVKISSPHLSGKELVARLNEAAPRGLEFIKARELRNWEKKLSRRIAASDNVVAIPEEVSFSTAEENVARFLDADKLEYPVTTKRSKAKTVNLRSVVYDLRVLAEFDGVEGEGPFLFLRTRSDFRVLTLAEYLLGTRVEGSNLVRVALLAEGALGFSAVR